VQRAAHVSRYGQDLDFPAYSFFAVERGLTHLDRTRPMAWLARALLVAAVAMLLAGALADRFPTWPGREGLRVLWRGAVTPWRVAAPPAGPDRLVAWVVPAAWLLVAFATFSSFASVHYLLLMSMIVGVFAGVLLLGRGPCPPVVLGAALSGGLLAVMLPLVTVLAVRGPSFFWLRFWTAEGLRTVFVAVTVAALCWLVLAVHTVQRGPGERTWRGSAGRLAVAAGAVVAAVGLVPALLGLERMLTGLNDELAVLPLGLSRILGITTHLDIPTALPGYLVATGVLLAAVGAGLASAGAPRPVAEEAEQVPAAG
jgi:hypothetical protein